MKRNLLMWDCVMSTRSVNRVVKVPRPVVRSPMQYRECPDSCTTINLLPFAIGGNGFL
ncbi:hypothetical protein D1872_165200 [compost metagenome]